MKHLGKFAVLGAVLAASTSFALADTLTIGSYGSIGSSGLTNNTSVSNGITMYTGTSTSAVVTSNTPTTSFDLNANNVWSNPLGTGSGFTSSPAAGPDSNWVGAFSTAGPGGSAPATGYYTFTTQLTGSSFAGGIYSGDLDVMADDTAEVFLNGSSVALINFGTVPPDTKCASGTPNCVSEDDVLFSGASALHLQAGVNTLTFVVEQTAADASHPQNGGNSSSGLDFNGTLTSVAPTPEPSSLMLLGTGLLGAAGMFYRRRQTV